MMLSPIGLPGPVRVLSSSLVAAPPASRRTNCQVPVTVPAGAPGLESKTRWLQLAIERISRARGSEGSKAPQGGKSC